MSIVETPPTEMYSRAASRHILGLRVHGRATHESLIPLADGKNSIGSGPRCSVRLVEPGVEPIHCLIVRDGENLRVRRWAHNTLLNGETFDEAPLEAGDRLSLGAIQVDVVGPPIERETLTVKTPRPESVAIELESPADVRQEMMRLEREDATVEEQPTGCIEEPQPVADPSRARSRKLVAALRQNRDHYDELLDRMSGLEQRLEAALAERSWGPSEGFAPPIVDDVDESTVLDEAALDQQTPDEQPADDTTDDWLVTARAALARDRAPWHEFAEPEEDPLDPTELDNFDAEVTELREQLAASESRCMEAEARIAANEQQLAEERRTIQEFTEERSTWVEQLAQSESRYVEAEVRIDAIEQQLAEERRTNQDFSEERSTWVERRAESESRYTAAEVRIAASEQQLAEERRTIQNFMEERSTWVEQNAEMEVRLAEYVERIQELAGQLEEARELAVAAPVEVASTVTTEAEPVAAAPNYESSWSTEAATGHHEMEYAESVATETAPADFGWKIDEAAPSEELIETVVEESPVDAPATVEVDTAQYDAGEHEHQENDGETPAVDPDVDRALAHLQELSIWRQTPVDDSEVQHADEVQPAPEASASVVENAAAEETPAASEPAAAPESYIDRYAHLFDKDEASAQLEPAQPTLGAGEHGSGHAAHESVHGSGAGGTPDHHDHEEAIEQYMAKMMERIRGTSAEETAQYPGSSQAPPARDTKSASADTADVAETAVQEPPAAPVRPRPAAELSTDMDALRALANQSARHAIGVHTARTLRRKSFTRCLIALLAAATSLYFVLLSTYWDSFPFATACVAALVALYFGQQTYVSVMKAVKVGAFDDFDETFMAIDGSKLPLPIDTKR